MSILNPFEEVLQNSVDLILSVDREYRLLMMNKATERTFLATFGSIPSIGESILNFVPEELGAVWKGRYDRAFQNETYREEEHYKDENVELYFELSIFPIKEDGVVKGACVVSRNITDRKLSEIGLKHSEEKFKQMVEEKDKLLLSIREYAYHTSHVLRRPVSNILALSEGIVQETYDKNERGEVLKMIRKEIKNLDQIIRDVNERITRS